MAPIRDWTGAITFPHIPQKILRETTGCID